MSYIKEKVAYLKGLAEGMELGEDKTAKLFNAIIATLDEMADGIEENEASIEDLDECVDDLYDNLDDLDDYLFDDEDDDEDDEDDDFIEVECPACGETIYFDQSMLENSDELICPNCNSPIFPEEEK